jgi:hypothetical protein
VIIKLFNMKKLLSLSLLLLICFAACKKDPGDPPLLPPAESMKIDFSNFSNSKSAGNQEIKGAENTHWGYAALTAGAWNLMLGTTLIVPVWSFSVTVNENPVYTDNKTWEWNHSATLAGVKYTSRLTGQIRENDVQWKMYISREGGFTEFLWFEGTSAFNAGSGQWILYQSPEAPVTLLQIDWEKTGQNVGKIKYTYVKDNDSFKGSYIEYRLTTATPYNAFYTIHYWDETKFSDVLVEWNTTGHNGRIKGLGYFGDELWHCWDGNLINTVCL